MHDLTAETGGPLGSGLAPFLGTACPGAISGVCVDPHLAQSPKAKRSSLIAEIQDLEEARADFFRQTKRLTAGSAEKNDAYEQAHRCNESAKRLRTVLETEFLPQHGLQQIISPRAFLESPLFRVGAKREARLPEVRLELIQRGKPPFQYRGPELRQSDAFVFSGLLHMARDVRAGLTVSFMPAHACAVLFGRYDGNSRRQLQEHIERLQRGVVRFDSFSVQLCLRFEFPKAGPWAVTLDADIVEVFRRTDQIWLDLPMRMGLSEGLATWLFGYVRCQTRLMPTKLDLLRAMCGSNASPRAFMNGMRAALNQLAERGVIADGWSLGGGWVRWMKAASSARTTRTGDASGDVGHVV
jgi:hypothetical protein